MRIFIIFLLLICPVFASEFGQYRYSKYNALNQQLQIQRMRAVKQQRMYNQSPVRNIKYPTSNNPYPNIQRTKTTTLTRNQRYSPSYYQNFSGTY